MACSGITVPQSRAGDGWPPKMGLISRALPVARAASVVATSAAVAIVDQTASFPKALCLAFAAGAPRSPQWGPARNNERGADSAGTGAVGSGVDCAPAHGDRAQEMNIATAIAVRDMAGTAGLREAQVRDIRPTAMWKSPALREERAGPSDQPRLSLALDLSNSKVAPIPVSHRGSGSANHKNSRRVRLRESVTFGQGRCGNRSPNGKWAGEAD
jgi:hypothetical protein